jgi:hypothetical protein
VLADSLFPFLSLSPLLRCPPSLNRPPLHSSFLRDLSISTSFNSPVTTSLQRSSSRNESCSGTSPSATPSVSSLI